MEIGSNFAAKLEPFLLMGKSAKGAAAAKLIQDATSAPGVFVFAELLELPNIQELAKHEQHSNSLSLLQLFSYKTYQDYLEHKDVLPPLNQAQTTKLKHLSIVFFASERRILPYADLLPALQMPTIRELEDLIIDAIYLDILRGKLDQKQQQLEVEYTMGRDLEPGKLEHVLEALQDWVNTTSTVLTALDAKLSAISSTTAAQQTYLAEHDKVLNATLKEVIERQKEVKFGGLGRRNTGGGGGQSQLTFGGRSGENARVVDPMDVDEDPEVKGTGKNRKAPPPRGPELQRKRNRFGG